MMTHPSDPLENLSQDDIDLAAGYALENLTPEEATRLPQQLAKTPKLAREVAAFQAALNLLPYDLAAVDLPPHLKQRLLSAAQSQPRPAPAVLPAVSPDRPTHFQQPPLRWRNRSWLAAGLGIAAGAIAALGLTQPQLRQQTQAVTALQQQLSVSEAEVTRLRDRLEANQTVMAALGQPATQVHALVDAQDTANSPSARLLTLPGSPEVILVAQGLPQLADTQVYRLWAVADTLDAPLYCGQFRQDDSGTARWTAPDPTCTSTPGQLLVTLDAPQDPITSAGPLILHSQ